MKISVVIITHNEEKYIGKCIESILNQTTKVDEIILVLHNSTDNTGEIANKYSIKIIPLHSDKGVPDARICGVEYASGDIILCIDGDSYAKNNWVEEMTRLLQKDNNVLVGSYIKLKGTLYWSICNLFNYFLCSTKGYKATGWIWGPSLGFWSKDKNKIIGVWKNSYGLSKKLNLSNNPEDYWLALFMNHYGNIACTNKTQVTANVKEKNNWQSHIRNKNNHKNSRLIRNYLKNNKL